MACDFGVLYAVTIGVLQHVEGVFGVVMVMLCRRGSCRRGVRVGSAVETVRCAGCCATAEGCVIGGRAAGREALRIAFKALVEGSSGGECWFRMGRTVFRIHNGLDGHKSIERERALLWRLMITCAVSDDNHSDPVCVLM